MTLRRTPPVTGTWGTRSNRYPPRAGPTPRKVHMRDKPKTPPEVFITFNYPELKDLGKHFLTISSATAVFLVTFVEKIVQTPSSTAASSPLTDTLVKVTLIALLTSIITAGTGLFTNYVAGAGASGAIILGVGKDFRAVTRVTYVLYLIAGTCLMAAYVTLATIGLLK
jgi:hypothetical protein